MHKSKPSSSCSKDWVIIITRSPRRRRSRSGSLTRACVFCMASITTRPFARSVPSRTSIRIAYGAVGHRLRAGAELQPGLRARAGQRGVRRARKGAALSRGMPRRPSRTTSRPLPNVIPPRPRALTARRSIKRMPMPCASCRRSIPTTWTQPRYTPSAHGPAPLGTMDP